MLLALHEAEFLFTYIIYGRTLLSESFFYGFCELVGAGCAAAALCAFKTCYKFVCVHAFCESGETLRVASAAAVETNVADFTVFDLKENVSGAYAACFIRKFL